MTDESTNAAAAMPPYAKREPKRREFHGDVFEDDYEWMRDKDSDDVRSYVAAENQYCERRMAHLADFRPPSPCHGSGERLPGSSQSLPWR